MSKIVMKALALILIVFLFTGCTQMAMESYHNGEVPTETVKNGNMGEKTGVWSPDGKWVAVTTAARTWIDTNVVDTASNKEYETGIFKFVAGHKDDFGFIIGNNQRPDPYVNYLEWCPDSSKLLLSFSFTDDLYARQTGVAVFNLEIMKVDCIMKLGAVEADHPEIDKPEGFDWAIKGYGLKTDM